jgi:hypothetical protein
MGAGKQWTGRQRGAAAPFLAARIVMSLVGVVVVPFAAAGLAAGLAAARLLHGSRTTSL